MMSDKVYYDWMVHLKGGEKVMVRDVGCPQLSGNSWLGFFRDDVEIAVFSDWEYVENLTLIGAKEVGDE